MLKMKNRLLPRRTHHSFHRYLVCQNWSRNIEMAYQKRYERLKMSPTPLLTLLSTNQISKSIIPPPHEKHFQFVLLTLLLHWFLQLSLPVIKSYSEG